MNLACWLDDQGRRHGDRPAIFLGQDRVADYAGFRAGAASLAAWLREDAGLAPGARVALYAANRPEMLIAFYAAWWAGLVVVPINAKLLGPEAAWIAGHSGAQIALADAEGASALRDGGFEGPVAEFGSADWGRAMGRPPSPAPESLAGDALAWLFYTSGTTGRPKGVMLSHANLVSASLAYAVDVDTVDARDAAYYAAPITHGQGVYAPIHVRQGARHVFPAVAKFDPGAILDDAAAMGPLSLFAAPTMVMRLVAEAERRGEAGHGIKTVVYGGGPMYVADIERAVRVMGPRFVQIYGQGECPMTITALPREAVADRDHPRWRERLGSVGTAMSPVEVRIVGEDWATLGPGEDGEIAVRGAPVMRGYWQDEEATGGAMRDGWLRTGDIGRLDADGYLTLTDRAKDLIISGGTNVYPREVEEVLLTAPGVDEVSVVGRPDPEWGEAVVACYVGSATEDALRAFARESLAPFKRPKAWFRSDDLPKNNYGKVLKTELRKLVKETARNPA